MNIIKDEDFDEALNHLSQDFQFHNSNQNKGSYRLEKELNQREKERKARETLQSRHGPTAETHDQVKTVVFFLLNT
jgi:hypothetical protein